LGKVTTCAQFLVLAVVLVDARSWWLGSAVLSAVLGALAGAQYTQRAVKAVRAVRDQRVRPTKNVHLVS
jgi:hypothetical protein